MRKGLGPRASDLGQNQTWRPPTRRAFVGMIAAAAAVIAVKPKRVRAEENKLPRWIGHF